MVDYKRQGNTLVPQNTGGAAALQIRRPPDSKFPRPSLLRTLAFFEEMPSLVMAGEGPGPYLRRKLPKMPPGPPRISTHPQWLLQRGYWAN